MARQYLANRSAPEDLTPVSPDGVKPRARVEFDRATWLRLNIGHDERADPKWLLPMLCRSGDLSRRDIGMIRIMGDHTFVQIHADATERFLAAIGPERALEDKCGVDVLPGQPAGMDDALARQGTRTDRKPNFDKKPYDKKPYEKKSFDKKPHRKGPGEGGFDSDRPARPASAKPWDKKPAADGKPAAKYGKPAAKPGAKPFAKPGAKPAGKPGAKPWEKKGR
ncbi:MAG: DbpA RNA binding domain-containing protein [Paracoccaceae bacterium]|nr:DbpA RNA binding domain-containing protein [Paracoccaceae bacterium]